MADGSPTVAYDGERGSYRVEIDTADTGAAQAVASLVDAVTERGELEVPPAYDLIDPVGLERLLVDHRRSGRGERLTLEYRTEELAMTVDAAGPAATFELRPRSE